MQRLSLESELGCNLDPVSVDVHVVVLVVPRHLLGRLLSFSLCAPAVLSKPPDDTLLLPCRSVVSVTTTAPAPAPGTSFPILVRLIPYLSSPTVYELGS